MAGALTERDFVGKLEQAEFGQIVVHQRDAVSVDDLTLYPLFTEEVIGMMRRLIAPDRQNAVATAIVVTATLG